MVSRRGFLKRAAVMGAAATLGGTSGLETTVNAVAAAPSYTSGELHKLSSPGIYNLSGTINDVLNDSPVGNAELIFTSPEQNEYRGYFTNPDGTFNTTIDTPVLDDRPDEDFTYSSYGVGANRDGIRKIRFSTAMEGKATVQIYNLKGELVDEMEQPIYLSSAGK